MYLVAIGWTYVVLMMSAAEAVNPQGSLIGAFFTFVLYGVIPLAIVMYIMGTPARRRRRHAMEESAGSGGAPDERSHAAGDPVAPERKEP